MPGDCRKASRCDSDFAPAYVAFLTEESRGQIMDYCRALIEICDEVMMADGWEDSEGCRQEAAWALECGKKIL